jgi:UDP-GlcNAc:undecaprenyl-phosphate GlcNAc-1-phosphate transferase
MRVVLAFLAGLGAGGLFLVLLQPVLASPALQRENYRGHRLPTAGGLVALVATVVVIGCWWFVDRRYELRHVLPAALGFGLFGLVDDLLGSGADGRGFTGHLRALSRGRLTTGGLKLLGGAAVGLVTASIVDDQPVRLLLDAALVALAANLGNLFDRAPGRTIKAGVLASAVLVAGVGLHPALLGPAVVVGAFVALLPADLGERQMLGDTGANALGAVLGTGVLLVCPFNVRMAVLVVVLFLNAASELVSFSEVIQRVGPLRWVDRAGRRPGYPEVP